MKTVDCGWKRDAIVLERTGLLSRREIANSLGIPRSTCLDFLRNYFGPEAYQTGQKVDIELPLDDFISFAEGYTPKQQTDISNLFIDDYTEAEEGHDNSRILFISDMHIPYHHKGLLPFLAGLKTRYDPTRVICLGDELDKHDLSFHDSDPDLSSAGDELSKSLPIIRELEKMFPKMDIIESNHGSLVWRKAKHHGIPRHYIKPYNEVLGVGSGWKWHMDLTITLPDGQQVYIHHGKSTDALKVSQSMGMSHVCGHYHESFGVKYWSSPTGLYWAMNTGCLIDRKSYAFAYANTNLKRQIIGTGLIIDGIPILEAMPL